MLANSSTLLSNFHHSGLLHCIGKKTSVKYKEKNKVDVVLTVQIDFVRGCSSTKHMEASGNPGVRIIGNVNITGDTGRCELMRVTLARLVRKVPTSVYYNGGA